MPLEIVLTPTDFVAVLNQTLEFAYPQVVIEGELSNFKVSKNKWVYFDLKDDLSSVSFFGTVYHLPGPLEDGLMVRVVGAPRLHQRFGFSINFTSITPVGEGALKKAADLLRQKLQAEGLFAVERKRLLPELPERIGLVTADNSAARTDFVKILDERWAGVEIELIDSLVQGQQAPAQIVSALEYFSAQAQPPEVVVITRGGGSADDLAAFNDERVVRAIAASRVPTLVAIGHEVDESLAELAADRRASTPTNAATSLTPDKTAELAGLRSLQLNLVRNITDIPKNLALRLSEQTDSVQRHIDNLLNTEAERLDNAARLAKLVDPTAALRRGYAIVRKNGRHLASARAVKTGDKLDIKMRGGTIGAKVEEVSADV